MTTARTTIGIDTSDRKIDVCVFDGERIVLEEQVALSRERIDDYFGMRSRCRVVLEIGTHSPWLSRALEKLGYEVLVANPLKFRMICASQRKDDRTDAETLARVGHMDPSLLHPVKHRGEAVQAGLAVVRSRAAQVRSRTQLINHARGLTKSWGERLPASSSASFHHLAASIPEPLRDALGPVFASVEHLNQQIRDADRRIVELVEVSFPEAKILQTVPGVGALTALTFVLTLETPGRFETSRSVGAYTGLSPAKRQSGDLDAQQPITKHGDRHLRWLLVQAAHYILGPFGPDSDLRRWGAALASRAGRGAKRRAVVAVARKLSVILHRMWVTQQPYRPLAAVHAAP